jgi:hypothetical protein
MRPITHGSTSQSELKSELIVTRLIKDFAPWITQALMHEGAMGADPPLSARFSPLM